MNQTEANILVPCKKGDQDCYINQIFEIKQQLLSKHNHALILKKLKNKIINKHEAATVLGFNETPTDEINLVELKKINSIADLLSIYRNFDYNLSQIKLKISQANSFIDIVKALNSWIINDTSRKNKIGDLITTISEDFEYNKEIKRSSPLMSGEIIRFLNAMDQENKINEDSFYQLIKSEYIYDDFSRIYIEYNV